LDFVDMLRGVGLLFMVVDHGYDWWLVGAANSGPWGRTAEFIGTLAAPIFLALVGVSMALTTDARRTRGTANRTATWLLIRRGLVILLWGYLANLLVFFTGENWTDLLAFDVLQCIGMGILLFAPLAVHAPTWAFPLLALATAVGGQFAGRIRLSGYLGTMVNGFPPIAYFPLLPWLGFVPLGTLWGRLLAKGRGNQRLSDQVAIGLLVSGLLAFVGTVWVDPSVGYRHPRLMTLLFDWGVVAVLASGLYGWCRLTRWRLALGWLGSLGRETLLLYLLHLLVGFRLFRIFGWVTGRSWRGQFGTLDVPGATLLLVVLCGGLYLVANAWTVWRKDHPMLDKVSKVLL
jgi:uncharacterized membrane protein